MNKRILLLALIFAFIPIIYNSCATDWRTSGGSVVGTPLVKFEFASFSARNKNTFQICVEKVELAKSDGSRLSIPLDLIDRELLPEGTTLDSLPVKADQYTDIFVFLSEKCASARSLVLTNSSGSYESDNGIRLSFPGRGEEIETFSKVKLNIQDLVEDLSAVNANSQVAPVAENAVGSWTASSTSMFLIGGVNSSGVQSSVLRSTDGVNMSSSGNLPAPRESPCAYSMNGALWVVAGHDGVSTRREVFRSTDDGATWSQVGLLPSAREGAACAVFNNRMWYISGTPDNNPSNASRSVWSSSDGVVWTPAANFPVGLQDPRATVFNGKIWVTQGKDTSGVRRRETYWSSDGNTWNSAAAMPFDLHAGVFVTFNNRIWHFGGGDSTTPSNLVYSCGDPCSSWTRETDLPVDLHRGAGTVFNGRYYSYGSGENDSSVRFYNGVSWSLVGLDPDPRTWSVLITH